jgi:hypothetical protein
MEIMIYKVLPYAGKEKLFMEVALLLQKKIYVGTAKLQILKHLELSQEIMHLFTANEAESYIHVVPMWTLASFKRKFLSNQYAVRPCFLSYRNPPPPSPILNTTKD